MCQGAKSVITSFVTSSYLKGLFQNCWRAASFWPERVDSSHRAADCILVRFPAFARCLTLATRTFLGFVPAQCQWKHNLWTYAEKEDYSRCFVLSPSLVELCCMSEESWVKLKSTAEVGDYAYPLQGRIPHLRQAQALVKLFYIQGRQLVTLLLDRKA
jgi:hypothetical protein